MTGGLPTPAARPSLTDEQLARWAGCSRVEAIRQAEWFHAQMTKWGDAAADLAEMRGRVRALTSGLDDILDQLYDDPPLARWGDPWPAPPADPRDCTLCQGRGHSRAIDGRTYSGPCPSCRGSGVGPPLPASMLRAPGFEVDS